IAGWNARGEAARLDVAHRAVALLDVQIEAWTALGDEARGDVQCARIDRLRALYISERMQDIVDEYERLQAEQVPVPRYVLNDVGNAYLYLRQPEAAATLFAVV